MRCITDADKPQIRLKAVKLYEYFRATSATNYGSKGKKASSSNSDAGRSPQTPFLDGNTALAYASGVMPSVYAATVAVMHEAQKKLSILAGEDGVEWKPRKIVDWGGGLGTVAL
jgi:ribosomal protein RSM22 (predicted rRNA methylase)